MADTPTSPARARITTAGLLTVLEVAGFAAVAIAATVAGLAVSGELLWAAAAGFLVAGVEMVYLANAYSIAPAQSVPDSEKKPGPPLPKSPLPPDRV